MNGFNKYLLTHGVSGNTARRYCGFVAQLLKEYGEISADFQDSFVLDKLEAWSKNSIATYLKAVRHYAEYKNIDLKPCSFKNLRQPSITPTFTEEEIATLTTYCLDVKSRWCIFWLLVMWTGCRCGEIKLLTQKQINAASNTIIINATKTKNVRNVPVPDFIAPTIYEYVDTCQDKLFPNAYCKAWNRSFRQLLKQTGIKRKGLVPHSFRHTFITMLLDEDVALPKVMALVGHRRIETTFRYTHLLSKSVKAAVKKHPVAKRMRSAQDQIKDMVEYINSWVNQSSALVLDVSHQSDGVVLRITNKGSPKKGCPTDQAAKPTPDETPLSV